MSNLDSILDKAREQAAALTPLAGLPAVAPAASNAVAAYNMDEDAFLSSSGMEVAHYIQVKDSGLKLTKDWVGYIEEFECVIDLSQVALFMGVRKEVGTRVTYAKSYDGKFTNKGEPFGAIVEQFKRDSQKPADPYRGAEIPMTLVGDYGTSKKDDKVITDGTVVGLSTSITGFKPWAAFKKKLNGAGLGSATVRVKVTHSPRKNAANQAYGVCEYELLEVLDNGALAA